MSKSKRNDHVSSSFSFPGFQKNKISYCFHCLCFLIVETVTHGRINMLELTVVEGYLWIVVNEDSFPTDTFIECSTQFNVRGL